LSLSQKIVGKEGAMSNQAPDGRRTTHGAPAVLPIWAEVAYQSLVLE
jgi:hypothetical protein